MTTADETKQDYPTFYPAAHNAPFTNGHGVGLGGTRLRAHHSASQQHPPQQQQHTVCIEWSVSDSGCGIAKELQQHIFRPFTEASDMSISQIIQHNTKACNKKNLKQMQLPDR